MSRWYIIHAYSGFENKVRDAINSEAKRLQLEPFVEQIEVPTETITEVKRGKKVQAERKFMPGYVLAKLEMNDQVYHLVKNTPKVTGFLGPGGKPQPIPDAQAARMLDTKDEAAAAGAQAEDQRRLRDRRRGQGPRRPLRDLQRHRRRARLRPRPGQGQRVASSAARPRSSWSSSRSNG